MLFQATALLLGLTACCALTVEEENSLKVYTTVTHNSGDIYYKVESNGIPEHDYGPFPAQGNPNTVAAQTHEFFVPYTPSVEQTSGCLPMGTIAFAVNGVPFFNPFNIELENAVEGDDAEVMDSCNGHPNQPGAYHYHANPHCFESADEMLRRDQLIGVSLDGYPIYSQYDANGNVITSADLDTCHGWTRNGLYEYRITADYPYILGCYTGKTEANRAESATCVYPAKLLDDSSIDDDSNTDDASTGSHQDHGSNGTRPPKPDGTRPPKPAGARPPKSAGDRPPKPDGTHPPPPPPKERALAEANNLLRKILQGLKKH